MPELITPLACTECHAALDAAPQFTGEIVDCTECSAELEVTAVDPIVLALAPEIEEDWGE